MEDVAMPPSRPTGETRLWYRRAAKHFNAALPIGNGRLGAMVFGSSGTEIVPINDDCFWAGIKAPAPSPTGPEDLALVRRLIAAGDRMGAEKIIEDRLLTGFNQPYLPAADLHLLWPDDMGGEYWRELDLTTATVAVHEGGVAGSALTRRYFSSAADQVIVIRAERTGGDLAGVALRLSSKLRHVSEAIDGDVMLTADAPSNIVWPGVDDRISYGEGITYDEVPPRQCVTVARVLREASGAALTILVATATTDNHADPRAVCRDVLDRAEAQGYVALHKRHVAAHDALFSRALLSLGEPESAPRHMTTDQRLAERARGIADPGLEALLFNYGRYLMISTSRPGCQPSNLQGIWNDLVQPPWWSNYTMNINLQMNYWPAEVCNLAECHEPLFDFIGDLSRHGAETARIHYGMAGWVAHHQTDFLRQTTPVGRLDGHKVDQPVRYAMWPMAGGWLCQHLWEHYRYGGNMAFLRDRAWPIMRGAALFLLDWLVEAPDGRLTTSPSTSPENLWLSPAGERGGVCTGSAMDLSILRLHFRNCLAAAATLGVVDDAILPRIAEALQRLMPLRIGRQGQIMEWDEDWDEGEHPHRHVSQLFDVFPGFGISPQRTPDLARAARRTLDLRGETGTGWSFAWKIAISARLGDPARAFRQIDYLLNPVAPEITQFANEGGGIYPNLLSACPPFEIDANFGYTAGVAELLLQSHETEIVMLPALPATWAEGCFSGLRARGGIELGLTWVRGAPRHVTLRSKHAQRCRLRFREVVLDVDLPENETVVCDWQDPRIAGAGGDGMI